MGLRPKVIHDPGIMNTNHSALSPVICSADLADSCMSHNPVEAIRHNQSLQTNGEIQQVFRAAASNCTGCISGDRAA
jgi:hypothetical protein